MKKILLLMVALVCVTMSFAQNTLVATLTHGDEVKTYFGADALKAAVVEATKNDIIVLSEGRFNRATIEKDLTIRGAGMGKTSIEGVSIWNSQSSISASYRPNCTFECMTIGDFGDGYWQNNTRNYPGELIFNKVQISRMYYHPSTKDFWFKNCYILKFGTLKDYYDEYDAEYDFNGTCYFINCKLEESIKAYSNMVMNNCIIYCYDGNDFSELRKSRITNSIFCNYSDREITEILPLEAYVNNCLAAGKFSKIFDKVAPEFNCKVVGMDVFVDSNRDKDLTEAAKELYPGTDGTTIGVYGGQLPYNTISPYPYISKMNVAPVTTADGKLSVDIEVKTAELP